MKLRIKLTRMKLIEILHLLEVARKKFGGDMLAFFNKDGITIYSDLESSYNINYKIVIKCYSLEEEPFFEEYYVESQKDDQILLKMELDDLISTLKAAIRVDLEQPLLIKLSKETNEQGFIKPILRFQGVTTDEEELQFKIYVETKFNDNLYPEPDNNYTIKFGLKAPIALIFVLQVCDLLKTAPIEKVIIKAQSLNRQDEKIKEIEKQNFKISIESDIFKKTIMIPTIAQVRVDSEPKEVKSGEEEQEIYSISIRCKTFHRIFKILQFNHKGFLILHFTPNQALKVQYVSALYNSLHAVFEVAAYAGDQQNTGSVYILINFY